MTTSFTKAAVSYYGIEASLPVRTDINTAEDGVLYLTLSIPIKDDDLGPIVKRMSGIEQKEEFEPLFTADISDDEMRRDYTALQPALKSRFGSFARYKAWRMENKQPSPEPVFIDTRTGDPFSPAPEVAEALINATQPSQGIGGRKVQHVDAPEEESDGLPESVWVFGLDMQTGQHGMASDSRECPGGAEYLMQTVFLTPEQKAKYGVES